MSFFHAGERFCAAPKQVSRFLMSDFPDKRLPYHRKRVPYYLTAPHDDVVGFIGFNIAAHGAIKPSMLIP